MSSLKTEKQFILSHITGQKKGWIFTILFIFPLMGTSALFAQENLIGPEPAIETTEEPAIETTEETQSYDSAINEPEAPDQEIPQKTYTDQAQEVTQTSADDSSITVISVSQDSSKDKPENYESTEASDKYKKNSDRNERLPMGTFFLQGGLAVFDLDNINDRLSSNNYSGLNNNSIPLGLGISIQSNRLRAGIDWNWLWNQSTESSDDDVQLSVRRRYWLLRYGVDIIKWQGLSIYPIVGIGASKMRMDISRQSGASFDDLLESPARDSRLVQTSLLIDTSLGIDYRFIRKETETKTSWITVGVRGGYLFQPYAGTWRSSMTEISDGPKRSFQGPVVQVLLGFSSKRLSQISEK